MWSYGGIFLTFFIIFKAKSKTSERRHTPIITPERVCQKYLPPSLNII